MRLKIAIGCVYCIFDNNVAKDVSLFDIYSESLNIFIAAYTHTYIYIYVCVCIHINIFEMSCLQI